MTVISQEGAITYWKGFGISKIESSKVLAEEDIEGMQITGQEKHWIHSQNLVLTTFSF